MRQKRRTYVAALSPDEKTAQIARLADHVLPHIPAPAGHAAAPIIAGYVAFGDEIDPAPLMAALAARGYHLALPILTPGKGPLRFVGWQPGDPLADGPYGLRQPAADAADVTPDILLVPLVGFSRGMARLGQGGGHYDQSFAALPAVRRIGLGWSVQQADILPVDPWDVPLHAVATEIEWIPSPDAA